MTCYTFISTVGQKQVGFIAHGQTICQLARSIRENKLKVSGKAIVLIGTNDILKVAVFYPFNSILCAS